MGSLSSEDEDRYRSYSPSADISESESCSDHSFIFRGREAPSASASAAASTSLSSSPLPSAAGNPSSFSFPAAHGLFVPEDLDFWDPSNKPHADPSEVEMMKERFAKLLLGEDMSGSGKGVCTALAISNAVTNLSATVFGELWRLEPLAEAKKAMWRREMEWLLCVSDSIVELTPSIQEFPGGGTFEVMVPRPRSDLYVNLPALRKIDAMLIAMLDGFGEKEFWYVDRGILVGEEEDVGSEGYAMSSTSLSRMSVRQEEKWWLPCPRVPANGLSEEGRKRLQQCRDCASQILKAAMAINSAVLADMEIPDVFYETLPKNGRSCLGDIIYRYITADQFSPECLLDCLDLSSEHHTLEIANRIEAAIHVWRQKDRKVHAPGGKVKRSTWGGKVKGLVVDADKNQVLVQRAEGLLQSLRLRYTGLPQTLLDMNKIQYNKDVGQSILESYSRVMESLAFNIVARIDDLIYVDDAVKKCCIADTVNLFNPGGLGGLPIQKRISPSPFSIQNSPYASPRVAPGFYSSISVPGSPLNRPPCPPKQKQPDTRIGKHAVADTGKIWSYAGNLSLRRDAGDAPERD